MEREYITNLCRAKMKDSNEWCVGYYVKGLDMYEKEVHLIFEATTIFYSHGETDGFVEVDPSTICRCAGIKDKNGKLIFKNDILMCHGNPEDLVKAVFGEFNVINAETLEVIDRVIGWHYEVVPTDTLSKCEPFCLPMPLTEEYVKRCEMEIVDNPELLKKKIEMPGENYGEVSMPVENGKTVRQNIFDILEA